MELPECTARSIDDAWETYTMAVNTMELSPNKLSLRGCRKVFIYMTFDCCKALVNLLNAKWWHYEPHVTGFHCIV